MKKFIKIICLIMTVFSVAVLSAVGYYGSVLASSYCIVEGEELEFNGSKALKPKESLGKVAAVQKNEVAKHGYNTTISLFGIIPVKKVNVTVLEESEVQLLGTPFGMKIYTDGVLVIGINSVETENGSVSPASTSGIKTGDTVLTVDGKTITSNEQMQETVLKSGGKPMVFTVKRGDKKFDTTVTPVKSKDGRYMAGLWIRDSSAGIGTLTFYSPSLDVAAGLGHGICDADTEELVPLKNGEFCEAEIIGIKKSDSSTTGELQGIFSGGKISDFKKNDITGVYGTNCVGFGSDTVVPVAMKQEVKVGKATFITTINSEPEVFECEITKIYHNDESKIKNMVIKVTDQRLLEKTGGIVQGMSGSPIIQNGKFVGAITHVLVDDCKTGYAIFAENMLETARNVEQLKDVG